VSLTGLSSSLSVGTLVPSPTVPLTGLESTASVGTVVAGTSFIYSIWLVPIDDPNASPVRIYLGVAGGTMALKIKT
jgi:hypothetical protein